MTSTPDNGLGQIAWNCSGGVHEWLPWCRIDDGSFVTRCIHCRREERFGPDAEPT
jgi:hypothetical protein